MPDELDRKTAKILGISIPIDDEYTSIGYQAITELLEVQQRLNSRVESSNIFDGYNVWSITSDL